MFAESIQGVGGAIQYTKNYLKKAQELIHANGGLYIADEVNFCIYLILYCKKCYSSVLRVLNSGANRFWTNWGTFLGL